MTEGDRVETPRGPGIITRITYQSSYVLGEWVRDTLVVVRLDENPEGHVRPVFFAHQLRPEEDATLDLTLRCPTCGRRADVCFEHGDDWKKRGAASSCAENQAEALAIERHQEAKHRARGEEG